jgi:hypothetical protein
MISKKQLKANQSNAKSGGVKTSKGKEVSKMNALKHGLLSREVLMESESEEDLLSLEKGLRKDLKPAGELELIIVDRIISCIWRLRRAIEVERNMFEWRNNPDKMFEQFKPEARAMRDMIANDDTEKIIKYESMLERSVHKNLHELQRLQASRGINSSLSPGILDVNIDSE